MQIKTIALCVTVVLALVGAGCQSVGKPADQFVLEHQRRIVELENRNRALAERLDAYGQLVERTVTRLEAVGERAAGIGDSAGRIDYLFGEYERTVWELVRELRAAGGAIETGETLKYNPFLDSDRRDGVESDSNSGGAEMAHRK